MAAWRLRSATTAAAAPLARRRWWIPAIRRAIAVTPGVLVTATGTHRAALVNFLGIYWLFSALRRDQDAVTAGLTLPYSNR